VSTLAIRRLIQSVKETDLGKRIPARLAQAEEDVESIERAAREFSEHGKDAQSSAWELLERIAEESKVSTKSEDIMTAAQAIVDHVGVHRLARSYNLTSMEVPGDLLRALAVALEERWRGLGRVGERRR
jgi:hypothetical protein